MCSQDIILVKGKSVIHAMLDIKPDKVRPDRGDHLVKLSVTGVYLVLARRMAPLTQKGSVCLVQHQT